MSETKTEQRFKKALDAFFADENADENNFLSRANDADVLRNETTTAFQEKHAALFNLLKQIVLFFPGAFVLYIVSFAFSAFTVNNPFNATIPRGRLFWVLCWFLAGIFMTWRGIGDWRDPKHLVIPASIISTGIVLGTFSGILSLFSERLQNIIFSDAFPLYLLPVALVVPFLAKGLIDKKFD